MEEANNIARMMRGTVKNKKSFSGGSFKDQYSPQEGSAGKITPIVLFKGNYVTPIAREDGKGSRKFESPYGLIMRHYYATSNKYGRCSAGLADVRDGSGNLVVDVGSKPCIGCDESEKGKDFGMSWAKKVHVFNGILLADFHLVDSDKKNEQTGKFFKTPVECEGRGCKHCKIRIEKQFGRRVYWPLNPKFTDQLTDFVDFILSATCNCGGEITVVAYECPKCGVCYHDLEHDSADKSELESLRLDVQECKSCAYVGYMKAVNECNKCDDARPLNLWDVKMSLFKSGEKTTTSLQVGRYSPITDEEFEKVKHLMVPVDLDKIFKNLSLKEQGELYRLKIPGAYRDAAVEEDKHEKEDDNRGRPRSGSSAWDEE
jgi:hypothetical protein